ncbi:MAG: hypothetical protein AB8G14_11225 [Ilumatobacter sp.]
MFGSQLVGWDLHVQLEELEEEPDEEPEELLLEAALDDESDDVDEDSFAGFESPLELVLEDDGSELEFDEESVVDPGGVLALEPRLSVLKKPDPLNVTPTGWNTFFTASTSPESGWAYSVSESSENACWTSMVSPVSTNL